METSTPAAQAARAAPTATAPWAGTWSVTVLAEDPADPGAVALAAGLMVSVQAWQEGRPPTRPGQVAALWVPAGVAASALHDRLAPAPGAPPAGAVVAVLGPGDPAWRAEAAALLPWAGVGVVDAAAEVGRFAALSRATAPVAGALASQVVAQHYALPWQPAGATLPPGSLPPGLAQVLGPVRAEDRGAADERARAEAVRRQGPGDRADVLAADPSPAVRLAVAATTRDDGLLTTLSTDPEPLVRVRAVDRAPGPAAIAALADHSSVVRVVAGHRVATLAVGGDAAAQAALRGVAASPDAYLRWKVAWGLAASAADRALLEAMLVDVDADVRRQAARSLGMLGDPAAVPALVRALDDDNSFVRRWAAEALGRLGDAAAVPALRAHAAEPTRLVAAAAARALQALGTSATPPEYRPPSPPDSDGAVRRLASDPDATRRKDLAKFLARQPGQVEVLRALARDTDSEVRKSAVEALGWSDDTAEDLLAALDDPDPDVRVTALDGLRRQGAGGDARVVALLDHGDSEIRLRAAEALAGAGTPLALAALAPLTRETDERLRAAAISLHPQDLAHGEPSLLVRTVAEPARDSDHAAWLAGVLAREDDLLHQRFSWNRPEDRPDSHKALRPPVVRAYGHPDRG